MHILSPLCSERCAHRNKVIVSSSRLTKKEIISTFSQCCIHNDIHLQCYHCTVISVNFSKRWNACFSPKTELMAPEKRNNLSHLQAIPLGKCCYARITSLSSLTSSLCSLSSTKRCSSVILVLFASGKRRRTVVSSFTEALLT